MKRGFVLEAVLCIILGGIAVIAFAQVIFRYVFHISLSWSEEVARFLLMWLTAVGAAYGFKTGSHFVLVAVVQSFGGTLRKVTSSVVSLTVVALLIIFVVKSLDLLRDGMTQLAPATRLPMVVPYSSATVGAMLMIYYVLRAAWLELRGPRGVSRKQ